MPSTRQSEAGSHQRQRTSLEPACGSRRSTTTSPATSRPKERFSRSTSDWPRTHPVTRVSLSGGLILADERRHHQIFNDLAESIRQMAELRGDDEPIPSLHGLRADRERIMATTERYSRPSGPTERTQAARQAAEGGARDDIVGTPARTHAGRHRQAHQDPAFIHDRANDAAVIEDRRSTAAESRDRDARLSTCPQTSQHPVGSTRRSVPSLYARRHRRLPATCMIKPWRTPSLNILLAKWRCSLELSFPRSSTGATG